MLEPFVILEQVKKTIQDQVIVRSVDLAVKPGQIVALLGGNGAGKSTILRMLAGIKQPTSGSITVGGRRWLNDREAYVRMIGYMPDDFRFGAGLTALETLAFWAAMKGLPKQDAATVLADVGLSDTGRKSVTSFSKGMRQRVMFAQALLGRPPLLLLDEPTNGLDPYWMDSFMQLVKQASDAGQTVIFSTHQLQIADLLADRIAFLRDGVIELEGSPDEIRQRIGAEGMQDAFASLFGIPVKR